MGLDCPPCLSGLYLTDNVGRDGTAPSKQQPECCSDDHGKQLVPEIGEPRHCIWIFVRSQSRANDGYDMDAVHALCNFPFLFQITSP